MQSKTLLQLVLFAVIILISFIFFKTYFFKSDNLKKEIPPLEKKNSNTIENISYTSEDNEGNKYTINSEFAELNDNQSNLIVMKNVRATITTKDSDPIEINSNEAIYNNRSYDTSFFDEVKLMYGQHLVKSDKLDLQFKKNLLTISNNIIYNYLNTSLEADKIYIDLLTKNSKIFMNDKTESIIIKNMN